MKITVNKFIEDFRTLVGDETQSIPKNLIIAGLNWGLNSLPAVPGLDKAFAKHYTTNLDARGHYRWKIGKDFRYVSNSPMISFYTSTGGDPCPLNVCYQDYVLFYKTNGLVSNKKAGIPCHYTLERVDDETYLVFDRPTNIPIIIDYIVWGFPMPIQSATTKKTITKNGRKRVIYQDVMVEITAPIENLLLSAMRKSWYEESADMAFAGAIGDYLDNKLLPEAIQMVNKQWKAGGPIIIGEP